jgi:hypothetical protein
MKAVELDYERIISAETANTIRLPSPGMPLALRVPRSAGSGSPRPRGKLIDVVVTFPLRASAAVIDAPARSIGATDPRADEPGKPIEGRQTWRVALDEDDDDLRFEVRSPIYRNEVGDLLVDLSGYSALKWILALLLLLANERFRESVGARLFGTRRAGTGEG